MNIKVNFRTWSITKDKEGAFHNENKVNSLRRHSNPKCVCT